MCCSISLDLDAEFVNKYVLATWNVSNHVGRENNIKLSCVESVIC